MLIVDQCKTKIINFNQTTVIDIDEEIALHAKTSNRLCFLGRYKTLERAKEVLQGIVNEYGNRIPDQNTVFYMPEE